MSDKDVEVLKRNFEELDKKVDKMISYLVNDQGTGRQGLVADMEDIKRFIHDLKNKESYRRGKYYVLTLGGGVLGSLLLRFGEHIVNFIRHLW